jgi:hypothetical protein
MLKETGVHVVDWIEIEQHRYYEVEVGVLLTTVMSFRVP